jgi:phage protein D
VPAQDFTNQLLVEIDGRPLPDDVRALLVRSVVDDSRTMPDLFVLRFRDTGNVVLSKAGIHIGSAVRLSVATNEVRTPAPLLVGEVTALEKQLDGTGTFTVVRGLDRAHRLTRGRRVVGFHEVTVSDVATKIARGAGLQIGQVDATRTVHRQLSQGNLSDWDFLSGLAADVGAEVAVQDGKLEFRRPTPAGQAPARNAATEDALVLELGRNLLRLRVVVTSAEQVPEVEVRGWDVTAKRSIVGTAQTATRSAEIGTSPRDLAQQFGAPRLVAGTTYLEQGEVEDAAAALAEQVGGGFAELEGVMRGNPAVRAGTAVTLSGAGDPFDGKYAVTASRHVFEPDTGYTTWLTVSGTQDRSLWGVVDGGARRPDAGAGGSGVVIAQVSDNKDPDHLGRVRLAFPWLSDDFVSDWARTVQPGAGSGRGALVVPEVGDEVLVAFEQGSFQRPYVIGGLYNGADKPDPGDVDVIDGNSGSVDRRAFVSRTGHRLEMIETASGAQGIVLATGDGKLKLGLDQRQTEITLHSDGAVTIDARGDVTVKTATGSLHLEGQDVQIKGHTGVTVDGGTSCSISALQVKIN